MPTMHSGFSSGPPSVQFIHRWTFESPEECVRSFDFTIACAAIWFDGKKWRTTCHERYYADLAAKRLVYLVPERNEDAGGSMLRLLKFYGRGYRAPLDTVGAVVARLAKGLKDEDGASWVTHHETLVGKMLTGLLREVDPNIDPSQRSGEGRGHLGRSGTEVAGGMVAFLRDHDSDHRPWR